MSSTTPLKTKKRVCPPSQATPVKEKKKRVCPPAPRKNSGDAVPRNLPVPFRMVFNQLG